ncbi:hypothetical protein CF327_g534 [Tilletia walkeri]|uniref:Uncharacterized protein n=1 Tax=Tilletia walkeri TaxID=117179 RepID=A0A8X7T288_9BASI|nr:hypothetical protein CF327_g534 [Tilletia walkeri]KAE8265946.1 hypothetical protein A4X09_0g6401 [Tilletia walkeri]
MRKRDVEEGKAVSGEKITLNLGKLTEEEKERIEEDPVIAEENRKYEEALATLSAATGKTLSVMVPAKTLEELGTSSRQDIARAAKVALGARNKRNKIRQSLRRREAMQKTKKAKE